MERMEHNGGRERDAAGRPGRRRRGRRLPGLAGMVVLAGMGVALGGLVPAAASAAAGQSRPVRAVQVPQVKPKPAAARISVITTKPSHVATKMATPAGGWSVTLSASPANPWATQYTTLTASANGDVMSSPYYITILQWLGDGSAATVVAQCGSGTQCQVPVTRATPGTMSYMAFIDYSSTTYPVNGEQARSSAVWVYWAAPTVRLRTLKYNSTWIGSSLTLDATTSQDIGPTPFYTELYDATTGSYLGICSKGTDCQVSVSQSAATTHRYIAYVTAGPGTGFPPPGLQNYSNVTWDTWNNSGWQTALLPNGQFNGFTAYAGSDVQSTPYYIQIYEFTNDNRGNLTANALLASCGSGTTCAVQAPTAGRNLVAFIARSGSTIEPGDIQANSEVQFEAPRIP